MNRTVQRVQRIEDGAFGKAENLVAGRLVSSDGQCMQRKLGVRQD